MKSYYYFKLVALLFYKLYLISKVTQKIKYFI